MEDLYLEDLLIERSNVREKITKAAKDLKKWFIDKIDSLRDFFYDIKEKIMSALERKLPSGLIIERDVVVRGEVIFKKGTAASNLVLTAKKRLNDLKKETNEAISKCKKGIKAINDSEKLKKAAEFKNEVIKHATRISIAGAIGVACANAIERAKENNKTKKEFLASL